MKALFMANSRVITVGVSLCLGWESLPFHLNLFKVHKALQWQIRNTSFLVEDAPWIYLNSCNVPLVCIPLNRSHIKDLFHHCRYFASQEILPTLSIVRDAWTRTTNPDSDMNMPQGAFVSDTVSSTKVSRVPPPRMFTCTSCVSVASWQECPGFNSQLAQDLSVWSLHVLPVFLWASSGCSSFPPTIKTCMLGSFLQSVPRVQHVAVHCS